VTTLFCIIFDFDGYDFIQQWTREAAGHVKDFQALGS
jgi:hypothetical protein